MLKKTPIVIMLVGLCTLIGVMELGISPQTTQTEEMIKEYPAITEEYEMVQRKIYTDLTSIASAQHALKYAEGTRAISKYSSTYYVAGYDNVKTGTEVYGIYSFTGIGGDSEEETIDLSISLPYTSQTMSNMVTRVFNTDDIYSAIGTEKTGVGFYSTYIGSLYSTDGGSSWNTHTVYSQALGPTGNTLSELIDICWIDSKAWFVYWRYHNDGGTPATYTEEIVFEDVAGNTVTLDLSGTSTPKMEGRCFAGFTDLDTDTYYMAYSRNTDNDLVEVSFDGTTAAATGTTIDLSLSNNFDVKNQNYIKQGATTFVTYSRGYFTSIDGFDTYASITVDVDTEFGLGWELDSDSHHRLLYIGVDDHTYQVFPNGGTMRIADIDGTIWAGFDEYIYTSAGDIYKMELTIESFEFCTITRAIYSSDTAVVHTATEPSEDEGFILYDDSDTLIFQGQIVSIEDSNTEVFSCSLRSPTTEDLSRRVDETYTDKTTHYILKDIIDTYCSYLYYDAAISTTPTDTNSPQFSGSTVADVFRWADSQEGYMLSIRPSFEVYWNQGIDSTETVTDSTPQIREATRTRQNQKYSKIILRGDWNPDTGKRWEVIEPLDPGGGIYRDIHPMLDETALNKMVANIKAQKNQVIYQTTLSIHGQGQYLYGTYITLTNAKYSITEDPHYVMSTVYDAVSDNCTLKATDVLFTPSRNSDMRSLIDSLDERIDQVNSATNEFQSLETETALTDSDTKIPTGAAVYPHDFSAVLTLNANRDIAITTETVVHFNREEFDNGGNYNTGTYRYIAPTNGTYEFEFAVTFNSGTWTAGDTCWAGFYIDGAAWKREVYTCVSTKTFQVTLSRSCRIKLDATQYVDIRIYHNRTGGALSLYDGNYQYSWFSGKRVLTL